MLSKNNLSLAIHLHLHYTDMWNEIQRYLENIGNYPYHLYVTMTQENPSLIEEIKRFHLETTVFIVENRGYDVGPFIYFLNRIDLNRYDLILKIHTKNNKKGLDTLLNHRYVSREFWFKLLMGGVLDTPNLFKKNIYQFEQNANLGMIGSKYLITSDIKNSREVRKDVQDTMFKLGFVKPEIITFVAGTMFIIRSKLLQKIKDNYTLADFLPTDGTVKDGTLAHVLERVFGCIVIASGYKIKGFDKNKSFECCGTLSLVRNFVYRRKITRSNHLLIKVFKIPVYHRKLL